MKAFAIALIALFAFSEACELPNSPVGDCPKTDGKTPTFLLDLGSRSMYYECSNGEAIRMRCPKGLVFNPRLNVCDYPRFDCEPSGPVGRCPVTDDVELTYLRDGSNPSVFYICKNGNPVKFNCDGELIFNPRYNACFLYM